MITLKKVKIKIKIEAQLLANKILKNKNKIQKRLKKPDHVYLGQHVNLWYSCDIEITSSKTNWIKL